MKGVGISFDPKEVLRTCLKYVRNAMSYIGNIPLLNKVVRQETPSSDAVIRRLSRMKETHGKKEQAMSVDPFRRTFLEKTRENLECGSSYDNREHMLRTKLQWFAGSEWSKQEIEHVVDKALKTSQRQVLKASLKNTNPSAKDFPQFTPVFETVTVGPNLSLEQEPKTIRDFVLEDYSSREQNTNTVEVSKPNFVILKNENPLDCLLDAKALEALSAFPVIKSVSEVRATALAAVAAQAIESVFEQPELTTTSTSYIEASRAPIEYCPASIELIETGVYIFSTGEAVQYAAVPSANVELFNCSISASETNLSVSSIEATERTANGLANLRIKLIETMIETAPGRIILDDSVVVRALGSISADLNWDENAATSAIEETAEAESHPYIYEQIQDSEGLLDFAPELPIEIVCAPNPAEFFVDSPSAVSLRFAALEGEITLPTHIAEVTKAAILENLGAGINLSTTQVSLRVSQEIAQQQTMPETDFLITIISPEPSTIEVEQPKLSTSTALMGRISSTSLICLKARNAEPIVEAFKPDKIECEIAVVKFVDQASQRMRMLFAVHDLSMFAVNGSLLRSAGGAVPTFATT